MPKRSFSKNKIRKRKDEVLGEVDQFNVGSFGMGTSMKNASIFTAPGLQKAVDIDNKRRKDLKDG